MLSIIIAIVLIIVILLLLCLAWRYASQKSSLPCPVWMRWLLDPPLSRGMSARTRRTLTRLDLKPGMQVLDAGCGPGRLTIPMAQVVGKEGSVTAMDLQEGMLKVARDRADREKLTNISFLQGGIGESRLPPEQYDRMVLITVLGEIPGREAAVQDLYQALKPGGRLLVEETIRDPHFQTRSTVIGLCEPVGFVEKEFYGNRFSYTLILEKPPVRNGYSDS
ncbi:MAG: class I SAM-dependent methyltransferase [Methanospirillum sp.]|uniref:class I SAM-dependent methyltransferase n=1 Tax=Methanospirillum sp. TaxID=45200 RepID=UPI00236C052A|nr:class I SAM-dependent methyltransferase [Methanospirillum sp.]MDD1728197.1 class I SAM-dependent methyltransferase [Methanospirillum sp.]